jgi:2',3'-cyclic-nucleotide 2'-phosphodiesterase (5'-nucleotidase family)
MRVGTSVWASALLALSAPVLACESCEHPEQDVVMTRNVRRMQPDAQNSSAVPRGPLAWGQLNFLHTTDTHGWLEGHIREQNYGADWGDYVSFVKQMRKKAKDLDVDLLVVDTGVSLEPRCIEETILTVSGSSRWRRSQRCYWSCYLRWCQRRTVQPYLRTTGL